MPIQPINGFRTAEERNAIADGRRARKPQDAPCKGCPWTSTEQRDKDALTYMVRRAAAQGHWFCCHLKGGTCHGAARYGKSDAARLDFPNVKRAEVHHG